MELEEPAPDEITGELNGSGGTFPAKLLDLGRHAEGLRITPEGNPTTWNTKLARVRVQDAGGELEIKSVDGQRTLTVRSPNGDVILSRPIETEEQRRALPEDVRQKLEKAPFGTEARGAAAPPAQVQPAPVADRPAELLPAEPNVQ